MQKLDAPIRFLLRWRGREPGSVDRQLDYGVRDALVRRGIAEWADPAADPQPFTPAPAVQPAASRDTRRHRR